MQPQAPPAQVLRSSRQVLARPPHVHPPGGKSSPDGGKSSPDGGKA